MPLSLLSGAVVALAVVSLTVTAAAYWAASGTGTSTAGVSTFQVPVLKATDGPETVQLEWTAVTPPGSGAVTYYVTGEGGTPGTGCPTSGAPTTVTSCTETGVSIGAHTYEVTAVWRSWTSASEKQSVTVTSGPATHLVLAASKTEVLAGEAATLTVTAKDAANRTVTSYTGSHSLVYEGASAAPSGTQPTVSSETGAAVAFGEATATKFTGGVATVEGANNGQLKLYKPEEAKLKVKAGAISNEAALVTVKVTVGAFKSFHLVSVAAEPEAGAAFEVKMTAWDEWHNVITTYVRTHKLKYEGALNSPSGKAPTYTATTEPTFTGGEATVTGFHFYDAATNTLKVVEETTVREGTAAITVKAAAAKRWAWAHPIVTAGSISSATCLFTCATTSIGNSQQFDAQVSVTDEYGNVVSNLGTTVTARVTKVGGAGTLANNTKIAIPTAGLAESAVATPFEYTSPAKGTSETVLHLSTQTGTAYTEATATVKY
jgi:hypothetical protein